MKAFRTVRLFDFPSESLLVAMLLSTTQSKNTKNISHGNKTKRPNKENTHNKNIFFFWVIDHLPNTLHRARPLAPRTVRIEIFSLELIPDPTAAAGRTGDRTASTIPIEESTALEAPPRALPSSLYKKKTSNPLTCE
jgi:hypothetical protein